MTNLENCSNHIFSIRRNNINPIFNFQNHKALKVKIFLFISIGFYLFLSIPAYSQDSLFRYLNIAGKNNPAVLQKFSEYKASLQKVPQVGSLPDPELSTGIFLSPMELVAGKQVADVRLMQMFPWFGVLKNAKDEMSLMAKAKYESFREIKLQLFYSVQKTWYELQKVQQTIRINEENLKILQSLERLAVVKFKAASTGGGSSSGGQGNKVNPTSAVSGSSGMNSMGGNPESGTKTAAVPMPSSPMGSTGGSGLAEVYRIQMEIGELENSISLLKNQQQTISARFNSYLNRSPKLEVNLPEILNADSLAYSLTAVSDSMLSQSPMLGMLKYEEQSLESRRKMVSRMGYPMVGIGLNYSVIQKNQMSTSTMNGSDMIMPMLTVTLPIYRKKYRAMREEVSLMQESTKQGIQETANSLQNEYYEATQFYHDARRRMKLYRNQSALAGKTLNILMRSFSSSGSDLSDLLRIRQQTLDYELKQIEAITDNNTAIAWLKKLSCGEK